MKWYAIVTFGLPGAKIRYARVTANKDQAIASASCLKGTGSCTSVRVYECGTRKLARSADISEVRGGERIVYGE